MKENKYGVGTSTMPVCGPESPKQAFSAAISVLYRFTPSLSVQGRICARPLTTATRPFRKY